MIRINGLSKSFSSKIEINNENISDITLKWFEKLDNLYFSNQNIIIEIDLNDKKIIQMSKNCKEKLNVISFKKNISIVNYKIE